MNAPANISLRYEVLRGTRGWAILDHRLDTIAQDCLDRDEADDMCAYLEALPEPRSVDDYPAEERAAGEAERKNEEGWR